MSDIQDLIHKTSINCIEQGKRLEQERIIKLLEKQIYEIPFDDSCCSCYGDFNKTKEWAVALIKGETE